MTDDPIHDLVRQLNPAPTVEQLLSTDTGTLLARAVTTAPRPRARSRRRLAKVSVAGLVVALGGAGTALAVQALQSPKDQMLVYCNVPAADGTLEPTDNIGATGDPVTDCGDFWRHATGSEAPALKAYQDTYSHIQVVPADYAVPATWRPLQVGVVQDTEQILLNEALGDAIDGLQSRCFNEGDAVARAEEIVRASGFSGWPVRLDHTSATPLGPPPQCWQAAAIPRDHQVHGGPGPDLATARVPQVEQLAEPLRQSLTQCWSLTTAVERVHAAIAESGFPSEVQRGFEIRQIPTPSATCTRIYLNGGGNIVLTLRGPGTPIHR
jgi:hypothetical protein